MSVNENLNGHVTCEIYQILKYNAVMKLSVIQIKQLESLKICKMMACLLLLLVRCSCCKFQTSRNSKEFIM